MKKKVLSLVLVLALIFSLIPTSNSAKAAPVTEGVYLQDLGNLIVNPLNSDENNLVRKYIPANKQYDKTAGKWGYSLSFNVANDSWILIRVFNKVFTYDFIGNAYYYISTNPNELGTQVGKYFASEDDLDGEVIEKLFKAGTYYLNIVVDKTSSSFVEDSDFVDDGYIGVTIVESNIPTKTTNADGVSQYVPLQNGQTSKCFFTDFPNVMTQYLTFTLPYLCDVELKSGIVRVDNGESMLYNYEIFDSSGRSRGTALGLFLLEGHISSNRFYKLEAGTYTIKVTADNSGELSMFMLHGAEINLDKINPYQNTNSTNISNVPTNTNISTNSGTNNANTVTNTVQKSKQVLPYANVKISGKNKLNISLIRKVKGVKITVKYKGKTYKATTNKKGKCSIKVKHKLSESKSLTMTLSKKGYYTVKNKYKIYKFYY